MNEEGTMIFCPNHNYEIVFLDVSEGIQQSERACCRDCNLKKPYNIMQAKQKINQHLLQETQIINNNSEKVMEEIKKIEKQLLSFKEQIEGIFKAIFNFIQIQKSLVKCQTNIQMEVKIYTLRDLQNLGQMIYELENNKKINKVYEFNEFNFDHYLNTINNELQKISTIVDNNMTTFKSTQIIPEKQIELKNKYQVIKSYQINKWIETIMFENDNQKALLVDCSSIMQLNLENNNSNNNMQNLIQKNNITGICFGNDLNWIITAGQDSIIQFWQIQNSQNWKLCQQLKGHSKSINKIIINESKTQIISAGLDCKIVIWNRNEFRLEKHSSLKNHEKSVTCITYNHSEQYFASGSADLSVIIWKSYNGYWSLHQQLEKTHQQLITDIVFDDYDNIFTAAENIKVWKKDNNKNYVFYKEIQTQNVAKKICYNKKNQELFILQETIEIWKIFKDCIVHKQSIDGNYFNLSISMDGQYILAQKYQNQELDLLQLKML